MQLSFEHRITRSPVKWSFLLRFLRFKFTIPVNSTILKRFDYQNAMINYLEPMKIRSWRYNNSNNSVRCTRCVINSYWRTLQYGENSLINGRQLFLFSYEDKHVTRLSTGFSYLKSNKIRLYVRWRIRVNCEWIVSTPSFGKTKMCCTLKLSLLA